MMETAQKIDSRLYTYRVRWSAEDKEFVGTCAEFPSISWLDEEQGKALTGICDLVSEIVEDLEASGKLVPKPLSEKQFSGKFQVRISPTLHRELAIKAAEENISLNRLISTKLAS